jgi:hypothetical protein
MSGDTVEVGAATAEHWTARGWVQAAAKKPKATTSSRTRKTSRPRK